MKSMVLLKKTDKQCEEEIDNIISGKNRSRNAWMVRRFIQVHKLIGEPDHYIRSQLIEQFKIKYGLLQTGKITSQELLKESQDKIKEIKAVTNQ